MGEEEVRTCGECEHYVDWIPNDLNVLTTRVYKGCNFHGHENLPRYALACDNFQPRKEDDDAESE